MSSYSWLRPLSHRLLSRPARRPRPTKQRLCLESLEDRIVPTIIFEPAFGAESTNFGSGPMLNATPVELIFWGSTYWNNPPAGAATASQVANAYSTLLGSPYYNHLGQYGAGHATNYLASWWIDNVDSDPGSTITDSQVTQEIVNAINDPSSPINPPSNYTSTPLYVVVTPQGTAIDSGSLPMKGKVAYEASVKDGNKPIPTSSDPKQGKGGPEGGVSGGGVSTTVGYHYDFNASTKYGNYNLIYAWIGNYTLGGLQGTMNNLDSITSVFSHESSEAATDSQPFSGITVNAGSSLPGGGSGEIGDFEPEDFNLEEYRVDGVLVQATWDYVHQAFVVSDGTSQAFYLYPQYQNNGNGNYTFLGNTLVVNGDQFGANYNDEITLFTTGNGGVGVVENGESVRFEPGLDITQIDINPGGGNNSVDVISTPSGTSTFIDDVGNDSVAIGNYVSSVNNGAGFMDGIRGLVDVYGAGSTSLYVDDSGDSVGQNVTMYNGLIYYGGAAPVYYTPTNTYTGGDNSLTVYGGYGGNLFSVENTSSLYYDTYLSTGTSNDLVNVYGTQGTLYVNNPAGSDSIYVGNGGSVAGIQGTLYFEGPSASNTINIDDSADSTARTVQMGTWTPYGDTNWGYIAGLGGAANINFEYADTNNVTVNTGTASGNVINVLGTGALGITSLVTGASATINVGNAGSVAAIQGTLYIEGPSSFNTINIDDSADSTAQTVQMGTWTPTGDTNWGYIAGLGGAANINFEYADTSSVTVNTGYAFGNVLNVLGTGVATNIVTKGAATVNIGNGGSVAAIQGTLYIECPPASNTININDSADSTARTVQIGTWTPFGDTNWGYIAGLGGAANINFEYADTGGVTIDGPSKASTYNIWGTGVATTVNAGAGNDTFNLGVGNSLGGLQGTLTVNGGGGTNTVTANDSSSTSGQSYTLSSTQLAGTDFAPITYASLHALNVTGSGNDTLTLLTPAPIVATTFNGGSGTNTLVGSNTTTTWNISGANSGKVGNVTFSNFQNLAGGTASNAFDFTTSTASLSGTINGGGGTNTNATLSYANLGSSYLVSVTLTSNTAGSATHIGGGFTNINTVAGSTDTGNTLTGPNSTNQWTITGNNAGNVNTGPTKPFVFTNIGHLVGGTGVDTFRFDNSNDKVLSINGGGAPAGQGDWLKYALFSSSSTVTVNLATGSATDVNGGTAGAVTGIQNVLGSASGTNVLTGDSQGNILIGGSGLNTIVGGSGNSLLIGGSGHGSITGGSGQDILIAGTTTYSAQTTAGVDSLMAILAELQSADTFAQKVYDLIHGSDSGDPNGHGSDLNGTNKLTWGGTVRASTGSFTLSGDTGASSNPDWFFASASSTVSDFNDDGVQDEHNNNAFGVF